MKQRFSIGLFAATAIMLAGCGDESSTLSNGTGRIDLQLNLDAQVTQAQGVSRADGDLTADDLKLKMTSADGSYSKVWNSVSEFAGETSFKVGQYTLEAYYGDAEVEDFESPYYYGSTEVNVSDGNTTTVSLTAAMNNSMVAIEYSDAFKNYFTAYGAQLHTAGGNYIDYNADETRPVYVTAGNCDVIIRITKPNGQSATLQPTSFTAKAKTLHKISFDVNNGDVGDATLVLSFDDTVLDGETVEIDLSDELMNAPAPVISPKGFASGEMMSLIEGDGVSGDLRANIIARGGLSSVVLTTNSKSLINQGWPAEVDLMAATDAQRAAMTSLGFEQLGLWGTPDKMASVNFNKVIGNIAYLESGNNESVFTLQVKDKYSKVCEEPMTFTVEIKRLSLILDNVLEAQTGDKEVELDLTYNGSDLSKVKVQYLKSSGTYGDASYTVLTRGGETYRIKVTLPVGVTAETKLRAVRGTSVSEVCSVPVAPFEIAYSENDVFAKHATITLNAAYEPSAKLASRATLYASTDGTNFLQKSFTLSNNDLLINDLEPATKYYFKVEADGRECDVFAVTTEASRQLENADMQEWTQNAVKSTRIEYFVGGGIWGTLNPVTMRDAGTTGNYAYTASSGTLPTDRDGGKAALIRTIAWGSGTTASGSSSTIKQVDRGELFLGESRSDRSTLPQYGIEFTSRPSSVSFLCKFKAYNNRFGYAEARVLDASGNVIAEGKLEDIKNEEYETLTIPLNYKRNSPKAKKLIIIFRSTNVGEAINQTNLGKSDVKLEFSAGIISSTAVHVGSEMYVDDIKLNY